MTETTATDTTGTADGGEPAPGMPADLSMVVLSVRDMSVLRRYYRDLGWREQAGASDSLSMFRLGTATLALHPTGDANPTPSGAGTAPPSSTTLVVRVDSGDQVDRACAAARRAGAEIVSEPRDQPWGGRSALVADPEGNRWELLWVPRADRPVEGAA